MAIMHAYRWSCIKTISLAWEVPLSIHIVPSINISLDHYDQKTMITLTLCDFFLVPAMRASHNCNTHYNAGDSEDEEEEEDNDCD